MYKFEAGEEVFNYYGMKIGKIGDIDSEGWFDFIPNDGSQRSILNGDRICSIETAKKEGYIK